MLSSDLNQEISVSLQKTSHQSSKNEQFWQYISNNMYLHLRGGETFIFASFNSMMCSRIKFRHLPMHLCDLKFKKEMMLGKSMQQIYNPLIYLQIIKYLPNLRSCWIRTIHEVNDYLEEVQDLFSGSSRRYQLSHWSISPNLYIKQLRI